MLVLDEELDRPGADILALVAQLGNQEIRWRSFGRMEGPERREFARHGLFGREHGQKRGVDRRHVAPRRGPFLENPAGMTDIPVVLVQLQLDQLGVAELCQIEVGGQWIRLAIDKLVHPPAPAVGLGDVMALAVVAPIGKIDAAVGAVLEIQPAKPNISG